MLLSSLHKRCALGGLLNSNALRQYEKKDLIHLNRNFESYYRKCNLSDIGSMINIRIANSVLADRPCLAV